MQSVTTFTLRVPATLLGDSNDADLVLNIVSETEMTADEHESVMNAMFTGLGMLVTTINSGEDIAQPEPEQKVGAGPGREPGSYQEDWTGMFFGDSGWISCVKAGSPAYLSGIRPNDLIHAIDGMIVCRESHRKWTRSIASTQAGEPLFVDIVCPVSVNPAGFKRHVLRRPGPAGAVS